MAPAPEAPAANNGDPHSLSDILVLIAALSDRNHGTRVSLGDIVTMLGPRSFAPIILATGLIGLTPVDTIPTLPTTFGIIVLLTAGQMLIGRRAFWLPGFVMRRAIGAERLGRAVRKLLPWARWVDRLLGPRLTLFTRGPFFYVIGGCCVALAATMPLLEPIPMASNLPALAFTAFGIALLAHDGAAALVGMVLTGAMFAGFAGLVGLRWW